MAAAALRESDERLRRTIELLARWSNPVGLLITDVRMPGMQGPELARRARGMHPQLPVLFATAVSDDGALSGIGDEAFHLIETPFTTAGLARAIAETLEGPRG